MTTQVRQRWSRGVGYEFSYVLARDIGDLERGQSLENTYGSFHQPSRAPMQDSVYRNDVAHASMGYFYPPNTSYPLFPESFK